MDILGVPHSTDAEQIVLGALLVEGSITYKVREIKEDIFYKQYHKIIFSAIKKIVNDNKPVDLLLVVEELKKEGHLESVGGVVYITSLTSKIINAVNIDHFINILNEKLLKRKVIEISNVILEAAKKESSIEELVSDIKDLKDLVTNSKSIQDNYIDASNVKKQNDKHKSMSTGFYKLDKVLDGFRYGTLTILTGKPSSGKSTIVNQFIAEAIKNKEKAFLYTGELPTNMAMDWFRKTVVNEYHIKEFTSKHCNSYKDVSDYAIDLISNWIKDKFFIYGEDAPSDEINLLSTIEHLHIKKGVRLFVLDNLMTMKTGSKQDKYDRQEQIVSNLKSLAKKYGLVIILVAHPKKHMGDDKPSMYDVSGASEIVNYADYILSTYRKINEEENIDETSLLILKNRITGKQNLSMRLMFSDDRKRLYSSTEELEKDYGYDIEKKFVQVEVDECIF